MGTGDDGDRPWGQAMMGTGPALPRAPPWAGAAVEPRGASGCSPGTATGGVTARAGGTASDGRGAVPLAPRGWGRVTSAPAAMGQGPLSAHGWDRVEHQG